MLFKLYIMDTLPLSCAKFAAFFVAASIDNNDDDGNFTALVHVAAHSTYRPSKLYRSC